MGICSFDAKGEKFHGRQILLINGVRDNYLKIQDSCNELLLT